MKFRKEIKNIVPYVPGKPIADVAREYNLTNIVKLASNENPLGCSPNVIEAIKKGLEEISIYPDGNATDLKNTISKKYDVNVSEIAVSNGSDEMIDILSKVFIDKESEVIISDFTFIRYNDVTNIMGGRPIIIPMKNWKYDLDGIYNAINSKTKLIWICNPNNPTGSILDSNEVTDFLDKVPNHIPVVYDIAYSEYVTTDDYLQDPRLLLKNYPNIIILKTFSKAYGLAGLRVGYTFSNKDIIAQINKVRGPFNVSSIAQLAAIAALNDSDFLNTSFLTNKEGKEYLCSEFKKLDIDYVPSETNHIFFNGKIDSKELFLLLQQEGVIIRPIFKDWSRVSIGTMNENKIFIEKFKKILQNIK